MRKKPAAKSNTETPIYDLEAFSDKATWADFYIQDLKRHVKEHEFISKPHKHDFYLILFIAEGQGVHTIDFKEYPVRSNSIFLMTPGQVHTWNLSPDTDGFVVFFTKEFYQMQLSENSLLEFPFYHSLAASPVIELADDDAVRFSLRQMFKVYSSSNTPSLRLLRAYLDILLLEVAKYYDPSQAVNTHGNTFKLRKLEQLIDENFKTLKQPSDYGELMNLSSTYLNSICKDNLDKTLTELIQERILLEAKRLFAYSDLNVNQVAEKLNFSDASYFIRWFKKISGITPEEFRNSQSVAK